jgi:hypothetical protein
VVDLKNSTDLNIDGLSGSNERLPIIHISGSRTGKITFKNSGIFDATKQVVIENEVNKDMVQIIE